MSNNFAHDNWKLRYSSLLSLGAITEGPDKLKFMEIIAPGLPKLIQMFEDSNGKVREAISWVI